MIIIIKVLNGNYNKNSSWKKVSAYPILITLKWQNSSFCVVYVVRWVRNKTPSRVTVYYRDKSYEPANWKQVQETHLCIFQGDIAEY